MRIFAMISFVFLGLAPVSAQDLPDRYRVSDVAPNDVLNIRSDPNAASDIIGAFGPYALNVEVLRTLDGWGQVPTPEGMGWVSMRFLAPNPWPTNEVPRPLSCSGTEPFWTFTMWPRGTEYRELAINDGRPRPQTLLSEDVSDGGFLIRTREGPTLERTLIVNARACSDGMSDRPFGMTAVIFTQAPDGNYVQNGCCTMQVN